jgi:peptide/nickel transport system permease protein
MFAYIGMRLFQALLGLWFIATLVFILSRAIGDPAEVFSAQNSRLDAREKVAQQLGLDKPLYHQYALYMGQLLRGDLGSSVRNGTPVTEILSERLPATFTLALVAMVLAIAVSIPLGVLGAVYRDSYIDWVAKVLAFLGQSMPSFWLGIMLIILFAVVWGLVPPAGKGGLSTYLLPGFTLGTAVMAGMVRLMRSSMLDVLDSDYVIMARAKGLAEVIVISKHALRNALIPVITYIYERLRGGRTGLCLAGRGYCGGAERGQPRFPGGPGSRDCLRRILHLDKLLRRHSLCRYRSKDQIYCAVGNRWPIQLLS